MMFEEIMADNTSEQLKDTDLQSQEAQPIPGDRNQSCISSSYIKEKLQNIKDKEKIIKIARENNRILQRRNSQIDS